MITLPTVATQITKTADVNGADAAEGLSNVKSLPQDFLTELGNQLLTLANQQGDVEQAAEPAEENADDATPATSLNALLAALENPDRLNALLQPEKTKAGNKSADDKDSDALPTLNADEMQNVQALFAMLPGVTAVQASTTPSLDGELSDTRRSAHDNLSQTLTRGLAQTTGEESDKHNSQSATAAPLNSASGAVQSSGTTQTLDNAFSQILSGVIKQEDKSALQGQNDATQLPNAPISSASTLTSSPAASAIANTPSTPMLNAQLGSNEWQQALSQQIVMFSRNGQQNAELRLHPEDLGAIQISLKLDNDTAQLNMFSGHSHVRAALEAALPQLRNALAESGINLGQSQVSSDSFAQNQGFQQQQQEARRDGQHGAFSLSQDSESEIAPIAVPAALQARISGNSAVDTFA